MTISCRLTNLKYLINIYVFIKSLALAAALDIRTYPAGNFNSCWIASVEGS